MTATLNSTGVLFNDSTQQNTAFIGGRGQVFTSSGTFTVPAGITAVKVTVVGGGGGSGATSTPPCGSTNYGQGGGAGGTSIDFVTGLTPGGTVSVTVGAGGTAGAANAGAGGAGGTSSFGAFVSASGGSGGVAAGGTSSFAAAGAGSNGTINLQSPVSNLNLGTIGTGQPSFFGSGGVRKTADGAGTSPAFGYGGGAGGGRASASTAYAGAAGAGGLVLVEW